MPVVLNGELTQNEYAGGPEFSADRNTKQIVFLGTGAPFYARFFKINPSDPIGQPVLDGTEQLYPAGSGDSLAANIGGVQFRSAVPGVPATIYGRQAYATDVLTSAPAFGGGTQACCGGGGSPLDVTDGTITVNPTTELFAADGLYLSDNGGGQAELQLNLASSDGSINVGYNGPGQANPIDLTVNFPSPPASPAATQERIDGPSTSGSSSNDFPLEWAKHDGTSLLSFTDPFHPTVVSSGLYMLTLPVFWVPNISSIGLPFTWKAYLDLNFGLGTEWVAADFSGQEIQNIGGLIRESNVTLSWCGILTAGQILSVFVHQDDSSENQAFAIGGFTAAAGGFGTVVRLSNV